MTASNFRPTPEIVQQAADLVVRHNAASVSLLQRHFRLGYAAGMSLMAALETAGIVTATGSNGLRTLTPTAHSLHQASIEPTARERFESWACDPFEGGDGGDAGSPESPSTWLFGIEHGDAVNIAQEVIVDGAERDYSIDNQLKYIFNRNAFKLFAAIHGEPVERYEDFARLHQPWVSGSKGFFKGNLYPFPCRDLATWSKQAIEESGFERKQDLVKWCKEHRLPAIADAVRYHRPRLFIGVGAGVAREFSLAYFGAVLPLEIYQFAVNGFTKKIRYAVHNGGRLVVLPHLSGGSNGLNSDEAIRIAGGFIAGLLR
jgi:hypothetical protein